LPPNWDELHRELLAGEAIHLWRIDLRAWRVVEDSLYTLLSPAEQTRFGRLQRQIDRTRSVVARGVLRQLLSNYLSMPPHSMTIQEGEGAKPRLVENPLHLDFNIAHSGDWALIALAAGRSVGVDIEQVRTEVEIDAIAPNVFTEREWNEVAALDIATRRVAFFRGWARKEALIKAMGEGLRAPLLLLEVGCSPHHQEKFAAVTLQGDTGATWRVSDLAAPAGYFAAVAWEGDELPVHCFDTTGARD